MAATEAVFEGDHLPKPLVVNGRFKNSWGNPGRPNSWEVLKFLAVMRNESNVPSQKELDRMPDFEVKTPDYSQMSLVGHEDLQVSWLGHASVLFQIDGVNVLSDPVFREIIGPFTKFGTRKFRDCRVQVEMLPEIHAVIISHDHYDHLDFETVKKLNLRFGENTTWFVPLGTRQWMLDSGCGNVVELNWGDEHLLEVACGLSASNQSQKTTSLRFVCAPAQHWCTRSLRDENKRLWGSWIVIGPKHRFYFAGDTGYCGVFKQIGQLYGPFDLAAIPIGAYRPRDFMRNQHIDPEEAVKVHIDVKARKSLAIHWGTFALGYENIREPPKLLRECLQHANIKSSDFFLLKQGETRKIDLPTNNGKLDLVELEKDDE